jgi:glutamate synthase domain-containing protein 3
MTGGVVVVLGGVGRNFAAGMSGGRAFVLDTPGHLAARLGSQGFDVTSMADSADQHEVRHLLERHVHFTNSRRARSALSHWSETLREFVRVMPLEYKRALEQNTVARAKA